MSWDSSTAVVLYQPIDFYAAPKKVSKSINNIKVNLEKLEKELSSYEPKALGFGFGRTFIVVKSGVSGTPGAMNKEVTTTTIQKLIEIQSSIQGLAKDLDAVTKGFERALKLEINPVNATIERLSQITESWLAKHRAILSSQ